MIQVELVRAADGTQLWGDHYNGPLAEIFAMQEDIARAIADKLRFKLTDEQQRALEQGKSVEVVDPATVRTFVVLPREEYERLRSLSKKAPGPEAVSAGAADVCSIPPGIRRSQEGYWRDLPALLKRKSRTRRWVGYHGDERIGFGATSVEVRRHFTSPGDQVAACRPDHRRACYPGAAGRICRVSGES